eukprot:365313-Chlamydomonas_euryale.AAC.13
MSAWDSPMDAPFMWLRIVSRDVHACMDASRQEASALQPCTPSMQEGCSSGRICMYLLADAERTARWTREQSARTLQLRLQACRPPPADFGVPRLPAAALCLTGPLRQGNRREEAAGRRRNLRKRNQQADDPAAECQPTHAIKISRSSSAAQERRGVSANSRWNALALVNSAAAKVAPLIHTLHDLLSRQSDHIAAETAARWTHVDTDGGPLITRSKSCNIFSAMIHICVAREIAGATASSRQWNEHVPRWLEYGNAGSSQTAFPLQ